MEPFSLKLELRIDWSEIDLFGHVNNLSIQKYILVLFDFVKNHKHTIPEEIKKKIAELENSMKL
jgi:hypothetical protein